MRKNELLKMEKGELHVHLNGLVSTDLIRNLLSCEGESGLGKFDLNKDLTVLSPVESLNSYFKPWQALRLVPRTRRDLRLVVESAFYNLKEQNVKFAELRNSVLYLACLNGISVAEAMVWLVLEVERAAEKYSIKAGLILTVSRGATAVEEFETLLSAYEKVGKPRTIIGLDLAGDEELETPQELGFLFSNAKDKFELNVTVHAGETGRLENIYSAINDYSADRIGHGVAAVKSLEVMELLKDRDICVEVCPVSNRLTSAVKIGEPHPVIEFVEYGVPFVVCSDNPSIHGSSITEDYCEFVNEVGGVKHLDGMYDRQSRYSFIKW